MTRKSLKTEQHDKDPHQWITISASDDSIIFWCKYCGALKDNYDITLPAIIESSELSCED